MGGVPASQQVRLLCRFALCLWPEVSGRVQLAARELYLGWLRQLADLAQEGSEHVGDFGETNRFYICLQRLACPRPCVWEEQPDGQANSRGILQFIRMVFRSFRGGRVCQRRFGGSLAVRGR